MAKRHLDEYSGGILPEAIVSPQPFIITKDGSISSNYNFVTEDRGKLLMDYINSLFSLNPNTKLYISDKNNRKRFLLGGEKKNKLAIIGTTLKNVVNDSIKAAKFDKKQKSINNSPNLWSYYKDDRKRLLDAAHYSRSGDINNIAAYLFNTNNNGELHYTGSDTKTDDYITYSGSNAGERAPKPYTDRDLVSLAITGDEIGVEKYNGNPLVINGKEYNRQYTGNIYPYKELVLPTKAKDVINSLIKNKRIISLGPNSNYGKGNNAYKYIDNVALHSASFKNDYKGNITFNPFDIWDFDNNYLYSETGANKIFNDIIQPSSTYPNSGPFILRQDGIPVRFSDDGLDLINYDKFKTVLHEGSNKNKNTKQLREVLGIPDNDYDYKCGGRISLKSGGTIYIKPENRGKFNATKERTGKTTEELTHSKNPLTRKRAIFAQNAAKWKH